jgi:hypothetical protein
MCFLLHKHSLHVFKFIVGFNVFHKKDHVMILLDAHLLNPFNDVYFNFECL